MQRCALNLVELVVRLDLLSRVEVENEVESRMSLLHLPRLRRLALVGHRYNGGDRFVDDEIRSARLLGGVIRPSSLHTLEFHSCDSFTVPSFLGFGVGERDIPSSTNFAAFSAVKRLVLSTLVVDVTASSSAVMGSWVVGAVHSILPGVTELVLSLEPRDTRGNRFTVSPAVDISALLLGVDSMMGPPDRASVLPRLERLEVDDVSSEHLCAVLKVRKKLGLPSLRAMCIRRPFPYSTHPISYTNVSSRLSDSAEEARLRHLVRFLELQPPRGRGGDPGRQPPWFL